MLQKSSMIRTAGFFFLYPAKQHYLMDISRSIGLAHTSVKQNVDELVKLGMITKSIERKGKRKFPMYKADMSNKIFKEYKMIYNLSSLLDSKLIEFIEEKVMPKSIVVFGSYRRGEDGENS